MSESPPPAPPARPSALGARAIVTAQVVRLLFRIVSAAALARLLTPGAYGLHGMAVMIYGLLFMVRDLGVFAGMQQPGLTPPRFNALCLLAFLGGLVLALVCALSGWPAAWFFDEPRLPAVLAGMALAFVFGGCSVPPLAVLYREQRVGHAVSVETGAVILSALAAIAAAAAGAGVWALVLMTVLNEFLAAAGAWWLCPRRPGFDFTGVSWRGILGFGAHLTGHSMASYLSRTIDQLIVGRAAGTVELGFYGRGAQATTLTVQLAVAPFSGWAVATLTRRRGQREDFVHLFRRLLNGLLHFSLPPAMVCLVAPAFAVRLLYGEKWLETTEVVRWLGLASLVQPWLFTHGWLLQAVARTRRLLVISTFGLVAIATASLLARHQGIDAIAGAVALATLLHALVSAALVLGATPVRLRDLLQPALAPLVLHGGLAVTLLVSRLLAPSQAWWLPLPLIAGYYVAAWLALPAVRREAREHFLLHT